MMGRNILWTALAMALVGTIVTPSVSAHHCDTKINVYGRSALTPLSPPPYTSLNWGICLRLLDDGVVDDHTLMPGTDQVMVRVNGDFGPSIQSLRLKLNGLGFIDNEFTLHRTANQFGGFSYNLPEWISLPSGASSGELTATVTFPGGVDRSVRYHTLI